MTGARLVKHLENPVDLVPAESRPRIGHGDAHLLLEREEPDGDFPPRIGVLDRIADQIGQDLGQARRVDGEFDRPACGDEGDGELLFLPGRAHGFERRARPFVHLGPFQDQPQFAVHHGGKIEQFVDHPGQGAGVAIDHLHVFKLPGPEGRIGLEQMRAGYDGRERGAQLVAQGREKFILEPGGGVEVLVFVLQLTGLFGHPLFQAGVGVAERLLLGRKALILFLELPLAAQDVFGHRVEGLAQALDFITGAKVDARGVIAALQPPHHAGQRLERADDRIGQQELEDDGGDENRADAVPHERDQVVGFCGFLSLQRVQLGLHPLPDLFGDPVHLIEKTTA